MMRDALVSSNKDKERKPPKVLEGIMVRPGADGGHIAEHQFTHYEHKAEPHIFGESEGSELVDHLVKHLGIKHDMKSAPEAEDETGGRIPDKKGGGAEADREMAK